MMPCQDGDRHRLAPEPGTLYPALRASQRVRCLPALWASVPRDWSRPRTDGGPDPLEPRCVMHAGVGSRAIVGALALSTVGGALGCGRSPTGTPFRTADIRIAGSYRSTVLTLPRGGPANVTAESGGEIRLSLGTRGTFTGRISLPTAGENGGPLEVRLLGTWESASQQVELLFEPGIDLLPPQVTLVVAFFEDRVELQGTLGIRAAPVSVVLTRPINDAPTVGGGFFS